MKDRNAVMIGGQKIKGKIQNKIEFKFNFHCIFYYFLFFISFKVQYLKGSKLFCVQNQTYQRPSTKFNQYNTISSNTVLSMCSIFPVPLFIKKAHQMSAQIRKAKRQAFMEKNRNAHQFSSNPLENQNPTHEPPLLNHPESHLFQIDRRLAGVPLTVLKEKRDFIIYNVVLGKGGNGKVYLGKNKVTNESVAVKEIKGKEKLEIANTLNVQSPYTIKMYDFWFQTSANSIKTYIVLEKCQSSLEAKLKILSIKQRLKFFDDIMKGMEVLNNCQMVHRDLKLQNILIKNGKAKIADFGLAAEMKLNLQNGELEKKQRKCGTISTMAPEILFSSHKAICTYSQKTDIWAIGIILHQILYLKHPFDNSTRRVLTGERVQIDKIYGQYDFLIDKCLILQPEYRLTWDQLKKFYYYPVQSSNACFKIRAELSLKFQEKPRGIQKVRVRRRKKMMRVKVMGEQKQEEKQRQNQGFQGMEMKKQKVAEGRKNMMKEGFERLIYFFSKIRSFLS